MAGEASFDVVSDFDEQELRNALDQVRREVQQRYDFKGAHVDLTQEKERIVLVTDSEMRAKAIRDLLESKAVRRGLSLKIFFERAVVSQLARKSLPAPVPGWKRSFGKLRDIKAASRKRSSGSGSSKAANASK